MCSSHCVAFSLPFPCRANENCSSSRLRFAVRGLALHAEMAAAGFCPFQRVDAHQLRQFQKIRHSPGFFKRLVEFLARPDDVDVVPEFFAQRRNSLPDCSQALRRPGHPAVFPHQLAEFLVNRVHGPLALNTDQPGDTLVHVFLHGRERRMRSVNFFQRTGSDVIRHRIRKNEISVRKALHQRAGPKAVRAVVGKIGFPGNKKAGNRRHQLVIHPQSAHRVVDRGKNPHRNFVRVFSGNLLIHVEEVSVFFADDRFSHAANGIGEVQIDAHASRPDAAPLVAHFLGVARGDVARNQVSETRVAPLKIIIALVLGNLVAERACRPFSSGPTRARRFAAIPT